MFQCVYSTTSFPVVLCLILRNVFNKTINLTGFPFCNRTLLFTLLWSLWVTRAAAQIWKAVCTAAVARSVLSPPPGADTFSIKSNLSRAFNFLNDFPAGGPRQVAAAA